MVAETKNWRGQKRESIDKRDNLLHQHVVSGKIDSNMLKEDRSVLWEQNHFDIFG